MRAAIYTRISDDQTGRGLGVARQLEDCQALAERQGWEVVKTYDDNDISAYSGKRRPGFEAMLEAMRVGEFNALLCFHTDRLYRSMSDLERVIEVADANQIEIRTVQGGTLDLSTSAGRMVARILGSVARQESEHSSERRKRANLQRAANGDWVTARRPFGYTSDGQPLEPEASAVRKAVIDVLGGKSVRAVAREWNAAGLATTGKAAEWRSPMVRRVLLNPRYAALVVHQGKVVGSGNWKPLIDEGTHQGIVAYLNNPARYGHVGFERVHQGSGVYLCGVCGARLEGWIPTGGKPRAYACADRHVRRQGEALDDYVSQIVLGRFSQPDVAELAKTLANPGGIDVAAVHAQRTALLARQEELAGLFAEGAISATQLKRGTAKLSNALDSLERNLAEAAQSNPAAALLEPGPDNETLTERWSALSPDVRGKIVDQLLTVTVNRSPRGLRRFDPEYVSIEWKGIG
ncbi:recombinase family protein [Mycolicibacterium sp. J2]|uniref:recombinase family protein n=1 Tax=Mycolicibacterium sp. J2 TaxID=2993511 RepID=UPI00224B1A20|nr:recombinase family protein [Mycolicibacterium sp. J2]MCX2712054.1 recombinase family protein [Mycolicibacterium sp. J2]